MTTRRLRHHQGAGPASSAGGRLAPLPVLLVAFGALLPVMRYFFVAGARTNVSAADVVLLPVLLLSLRHVARARGLTWWLFALLLTNVAAWVLSAPMLTVQAVATGMVRLAVCCLYGFAGFAAAGSTRKEASLLAGMLASAVPIAAVSIYAYFTGHPRSFLMEDRAQGTFTDPNAFACYLAVVIALTAHLPSALLAAPVLAAGGLASLSRTGIVSLGCALVLVVWHQRRRRLLAAGVLIASVTGFLVLWHFIGSGFGGARILGYEDTLERRVDLWTLAQQVGAAHFILGVGKGNWVQVTGQRATPHNTFLTLLADTGLIGLLVFIVPLFVWLYRGRQSARSAKWTNAVAVCLVGGISLGLENFRPFWLAVGALCGVLQQERARRRQVRFLSSARPVCDGAATAPGGAAETGRAARSEA